MPQHFNWELKSVAGKTSHFLMTMREMKHQLLLPLGLTPMTAKTWNLSDFKRAETTDGV